jgi:hypothetical protein
MIDFPSSPIVGQQFTAAGVTWTWDGTKWLAAGTSPGFLPLIGGTLTGALSMAPPAGNSPVFIMDKIAGGLSAGILTQTNGLGRWNVFFGDTSAESGANAGSNFTIQSLSETGALLGTDLSINRASGLVTIPSLNAPGVINSNRVDNGDMLVDQHNAGALVVMPDGGAWCPDRFIASNIQATSRFNVQQNLPAITTKAPGFQYFLGVQSTGAYTSGAGAQLLLQHCIEADNIGDLGQGAAGAQPFTVSFWARSSLTGNFSFAIQSGATVTSGGTTYRTYITTYALPVANTWTKIVIPIPGDTVASALAWPNVGNAPGLYLSWDLGTGTTHQSATLNAWQSTAAYAATGAVHVTGTANATLGITGVKLEAGSVATPFPYQPLAEKLVRCQRYFETGYPQWQSPGTLDPPNGLFVYAIYSPDGPNINAGGFVSFKTTKRAVPTMTFYSQDGTPGAITDAGLGPNVDMAVNAGPSTVGSMFWGVTSASSIGVNLQGNWAASAEI